MATSKAHWRRGLAIHGAATGLAAAYLAALFLDMPIGTEARDYIFHDGFLSVDGDDIRYALTHLVYPIGENTRVVSMAVFALSHHACGLNTPCLNAIQIGLLLAAFLAGAWHMQQLLGRPALSAIAMLCWAVSLPVFSAAYWQATQHDKLAFIFAFAGLGLGLSALRGNGHGYRLAKALGVLALFVLAMNAKEMAFFLPAAALAQVLLLAPGATLMGKLRAGAVYAVALAYAALYIGVYLARLQAGWRGHVLSGHLSAALYFYAGSLTGGHPTSFVALALLATLAAISIGMATSPRGEPQLSAGGYTSVCLYCLTIFLSSIVLVARAQFPADYYMLVPLWAVLGWLAATNAAACADGWRVRLPVLALTAMLAACFAAGRCADYLGVAGLFQQQRDASRLYKGYADIRATCATGLAGGLKLAFRRRPVGEWWYFRGYDEKPDQLVGAYICRDGQVPPMTYSLDGNDHADRPGQTVVLWDDTLAIMRISKDSVPAPSRKLSVP